MFKHATRTPAMNRCSKLPYQLPANAEAMGYQNVVHTDSRTRQKERDRTPEPTSAWLDTPGLAEKAFAVHGGRPPSADREGKSSLSMPYYRPDPKQKDMIVAYPDNIRPSYAELATLLQRNISEAFEKGLLNPPIFPGAGEDHKASTLLKIKDKPWISIEWKKTADMDKMWEDCIVGFNATRIPQKQVNKDTLLKNVMGLGYSVSHRKRTLTFDVDKWNIGCYRIKHCGVTKGTGSRPNIHINLIPEIPTYYKDFGKEKPLCQPVSRSSVKPEEVNLLLCMTTRIEKTPDVAKEMATCSEILVDLGRKRKRGFFQPPTSKKGKGPCPRLSSRKGKGKG